MPRRIPLRLFSWFTLFFVAGSLSLNMFLAGHVGAAGPLNLKGKWTAINPAKWDSVVGSTLKFGGSTHMALLRGNVDSSFVLHWHDASTDREPQLNLLHPMSDSTVGYPVPEPDRLFCSGHSTLADGRLMVVGGTTQATTGLARSNAFDARSWFNPVTRGWTVMDTLVRARWYPTSTTLGDERVLATSGQSHVNMIAFGGYRPNGSNTDSMHTLNMKQYHGWNIDPIAAGSGTRPSARQGHAMVYHAGRILMFGGRGAVDRVGRSDEAEEGVS